MLAVPPHTPSAEARPPCLADLEPGLEEAVAAGPREMAAALAFTLARRARTDPRPVLFAAPRRWTAEHGRPHGQGLLLALPRTEPETLWALEQALRSGAVAAAVGAVEAVSLTASRRLAFAAREGRAGAMLLRATPGGLSAAARRWRVASLESAPHPLDPRAPGATRLRVELTRRRDGPPAAWLLEQDHETDRLRLADRLAGDGLVALGRTRAAA